MLENFGAIRFSRSLACCSILMLLTAMCTSSSANDGTSHRADASKLGGANENIPAARTELSSVDISSRQWKPDLAPPNVELKPGVLPPEIVKRLKRGCYAVFWQNESGSENAPFAITWSGPQSGEGPNLPGLFAMGHSILEMDRMFVSTFHLSDEKWRETVVGEEIAPKIFGSADTPMRVWSLYAKRLKTRACVPDTDKCKMHEARAKIIETRADVGMTQLFRAADIGSITVKVSCADQFSYAPFWKASVFRQLFEGVLRKD